MHLPFFIYLFLCLVGVSIRTTYELLKKAGKLDTKNNVIFGIVFAAMILFLASWPFMTPLDPWHLTLLPIFRWLAIGFVIVGLSLALGGMIQLRGLENIDHLTTTGVFSKIRHPMYTGFILWILGWVMFHGAGISFLAGVVSIGAILVWRHLEELKLVSDYGSKYEAYIMQTWF